MDISALESLTVLDEPNNILESSPTNETVNKTEVEATTLQIIEDSEKIPQMVFDMLGENATRCVFGGKGTINMCIEERGFMVIPDTGATLIPRDQIPRTEYLLRSPWLDAINNFKDTYIPLKLTPDISIHAAETTSNKGEDALEVGFTRGKMRKESVIDANNVLDPNGDVIDTPEAKKMYGRMKSLVSAGVARGLKNIDSVENFDKASPSHIVDLYQQMYRGPISGDTKSGIDIIQESAKSYSVSAEEASKRSEPMFYAEVNYSEENPLEKVMKPNTSLAREYVAPVVDLINKAIGEVNNKSNYKVFNEINPKNLVPSLLYKSQNRNDLRENLIPMVLSSEICVFVGKRGMFAENLFVLMKKEEKWAAGVFTRFSNENVGKQIDKWYEEL